MLHCYETLIYFCVWTSANFYSLFKLYESQTEIFSENKFLKSDLTELSRGWDLLSRPQDISDIEWNTWKFLYKLMWHYLLFQFAISETIRYLKPNLLKQWYLASSVLFIMTNLGLKHFLIMVSEPLIYAMAVFSNCSRKMLWFISVLMLISYNSLKYRDVLWSVLDHEYLKDEEIYLVLVSMGWIQLRCISYCLDYIEKRDKHKDIEKKVKDKDSLVDNCLTLFSYSLYLPLLYFGPLIMFNEYEKSIHARYNLYSRLKKFTINVILFTFYIFLLDVAFHFIYFLAMQEKVELLSKLPTMALSGGGLWMGLQFHMKYVVIYGICGVYSSLDNIDPPPTPRCISRVHVYSQMWRYFDVSLYKFLKRYIYTPCFEIIRSLQPHWWSSVQRMLASLVVFSFVFLWHGTTKSIFVWTILNYFGIACESLAKTASKTNMYEIFKRNILKTDNMEQRFIAILCAPLLALSAISNFYLFAGYDIGNLFFQRFTNPSLINAVILLFSLYSGCHVSILLKNVHTRTTTETSIDQAKDTRLCSVYLNL